MYQNLAVLLFLGVLVYGSRMSLSNEAGEPLGELYCSVQSQAVLLQEAMFGNENPDIEDGDGVRHFVIRDADLVMAVIEELEGSESPGRKGEVFHTNRSGDAIDFTRQVSAYVTLNYEYNIKTGKIDYNEITHDPWRAGNNTIFIAKGSCRDNLAPVEGE